MEQSDESLLANVDDIYCHAFALCLDRRDGEHLALAAFESVISAGPEAVSEPASIFRSLREIWLDGSFRAPQGRHRTRDGGNTLNRPHVTVQGVLAQLSSEEREILSLACCASLSYRNAAAVLGLPMSTFMNRLARARRRFAQVHAGLETGGATAGRPSLAEEMLMAHADDELTTAGLATIERTLAENPALGDVLSMFVQTRTDVAHAIRDAAGTSAPASLRKAVSRRLGRSRAAAPNFRGGYVAGAAGGLFGLLLLAAVGLSAVYFGSRQFGYDNIITRLVESVQRPANRPAAVPQANPPDSAAAGS